MSRSRRSLAIRDQAVSAFSGALMRLCDSTAAHGAALVDAEGETVDYAGYLDPFEIRLVAAELRLVLGVLEAQTSISGASTEILIRGTKRSFAVISMPDGYALIIELPRTSLLSSPRAVAEAVRTLSIEGGLPPHPAHFGRESWSKVDVRWDSRARRPSAIWLEGGWRAIEVLGRFNEAEPGHRTLGFRVRLADGTELTLVREPLGLWFVDELPLLPL
jgi:hypothetical protein